ncbi:hypothetical protein L1887_13381 [Cichorium endivia]|nr:hypothetical protein L1887_13381 [Cichorium endivia]
MIVCSKSFGDGDVYLLLNTWHQGDSVFDCQPKRAGVAGVDMVNKHFMHKFGYGRLPLMIHINHIIKEKETNVILNLLTDGVGIWERTEDLEGKGGFEIVKGEGGIWD